MATRAKVSRALDDDSFERAASIQRKRNVHERILQQCVNMRNQKLTSHDNIVLYGRYSVTPLDALKKDKLPKKSRSKKGLSYSVDEGLHLPSLGNRRNMKSYSNLSNNISSGEEHHEQFSLPSVNRFQYHTLYPGSRATDSELAQQHVKRSVEQYLKNIAAKNMKADQLTDPSNSD